MVGDIWRFTTFFRFPDFLDVLENLKMYLLPLIGVCTLMVVMDRHSFYTLR